MKRIHALIVAHPPESFASLAEALGSRGERLGWLDWRPQAPRPRLATEGDGPGAELEAAARPPFLRAVAVGCNGLVALKPVGGPPVLRDVLREHFRGCLAVLVRTGARASSLEAELESAGFESARLEPSGDNLRYRVASTRAAGLWDPALLADRLRKPRPFGSGEA
ncbi:MAG: hypothetical protein AAF725_02340 [Acidobacteriota bacterium]